MKQVDKYFGFYNSKVKYLLSEIREIILDHYELIDNKDS